MLTKGRASRALASAFLFVQLFASHSAEASTDVLFGPSSSETWSNWFENLKSERLKIWKQAGLDPQTYETPGWSSNTYRQYFLFLYDRMFLRDGHYRTRELIEELRSRFGVIDSVLLWQAYPQLGFDRRDQLDYYRDLPGGLEALRRDVIDVFHQAGIRVFMDFNPWDSTIDYAKVARLVGFLDIDGIMLDTMENVPSKLKAAVDAVKPGVVFAPEIRPSDEQLAWAHQSWAQWFDLGQQSSIYRIKWILPPHQEFAIRRWDTDRLPDTVYSFFNGAGLLLWDDVFGTWNPYERQDRAMIAGTGVLLTEYTDFFRHGEWRPLIPTGVEGVDANSWVLDDGNERRELWILRNRTSRTLSFSVPKMGSPSRSPYRFFSGLKEANLGARAETGSVEVSPRGTELLVVDSDNHAQKVFTKFADAFSKAIQDRGPSYEQRTPAPTLTKPKALKGKGIIADEATFASIPSGHFELKIEHARRESGCTSWGADENNLWGWFYRDLIHHVLSTEVKAFQIKATTVTNQEFLDFVQRTGYQPRSGQNFLKQIPRLPGGALPISLSPDLARLPVTYVSLEDARAYAAAKGERLPTEVEWQWAAEGAGEGNLWPWGQDGSKAKDPSWVNLTGKIAAADANPKGATSQGVLGLTGNVWEWTESEWTDSHTRYAMVRGGSFLPPGPSEWMIPRGPRPNSFHAKYLLLSESVDRSEAVGFRTVH